MKVTRSKLQLSSHFYSREWQVERSVGCHMMPIVEYMAQTAELEKSHDPELAEHLETFATLGFVWEHTVTRVLSAPFIEHVLEKEFTAVEIQRRPQELISPGELFWCYQCDEVTAGGRIAREHCLSRGHTGIFGTPDSINTTGWHLEEWKCTWKSSRRAGGDEDSDCIHVSEGIWRWPTQSMGYGFMTDLHKTKLRGFFVCGDWGRGKQPLKPEAWNFDFEFTKAEINRNWSNIVDTGRELKWL